MNKIKNVFKPDVQKEAEAQKAAEEAQRQEQSSNTETTSSAAQPTVTSSDLEAQPTTSLGTGGGLTEPTESKYGATPGHGISSYQAEPSSTTGDEISSGRTYGTSGYSTHAPQIGSGNAPQIGKPDLGEDITAGLGSGITKTSTDDSYMPNTSVEQRQDPATQDSSTGYSRDAAIGTGAFAAGAAGTAGAYEYSQSKDTTESKQPAEEKKGKLSSLLHRSNPSKLQKEPKNGAAKDSNPTPETSTSTTTAATGAGVATAATSAATYEREESDPRVSTTTGTSSGSIVKPAAHETFVRPGYHHEHHVGVDGPIGRPMEVSGVHGTDARRTSVAAEIDKSLDPNNPALLRPEESEPTLAERQSQLGDGRVIDPFTGLVKNVGKYGTGAGGTDGAPQIQGYDAATQAERLKIHDEEREANKEMTWEKIRNPNETL